MRALSTLLAGVVDYAGLFPPAALDLPTAARNYAEYRGGDARVLLGRFVLPASQLGALAPLVPNATGEPWPLAVLIGADHTADAACITALDASVARVDALEIRAGGADDLPSLARAYDLATRSGVSTRATFVEIPWGADARAFAEAARDVGVALKLRTGGVTPDAFPAPEIVLRFMHACIERGVPFKLTAGLHHALRGEHALTYEPGCPRGTMHGFLNVLAAASLLAAGHAPSRVAPLLEERDAHALQFTDDAIEWRGLVAGLTDIAVERRGFVSFGSCSFDEPVAELRAMGCLPRDAAMRG